MSRAIGTLWLVGVGALLVRIPGYFLGWPDTVSFLLLCFGALAISVSGALALRETR